MQGKTQQPMDPRPNTLPIRHLTHLNEAKLQVDINTFLQIS
jgi:hypothetical protein